MLCSLMMYGQYVAPQEGQLTYLQPLDTIRFIDGTYHFMLKPGTYVIRGNTGANVVQTGIASEVNLYAPNYRIRLNGGAIAASIGASTVYFCLSITDACGNLVRQVRTGTANFDHYLYSYARLRVRSISSSTSYGLNQPLIVTVDTIPVMTTTLGGITQKTDFMTVYDVEVKNVTTSSAQITWEDKNPNNKKWIIQYGPVGFTWSSNPVAPVQRIETGTKSVTLTGLTSGTHYDFYVYADGYTQGSNFISDGTYRYFYGCGLGKNPLEFTTETSKLNECFNFTDLTADYVDLTYGTAADPLLYTGTTLNTNTNTYRHAVNTVNEREPRSSLRLNTIPPGGEKSIRLGDWLIGGNNAANSHGQSITYRYAVDTTQANLLFFRYASILQDNGTVKPMFNIKIFDGAVKNAGKEILCYTANLFADFSSTAGSGWNNVPYNTGDAAVATSTVQGTSSITAGSAGYAFTRSWKDWTTAGIDLAPYQGDTITIELKTVDASTGIYYGYGYFNLSCGKKSIITSECDNTGYTFTSPPGFEYKWYFDDNSNGIIDNGEVVTGNKQKVTVNRAGNLVCECSSVLNSGCTFTIQTKVVTRLPQAEFFSYSPSLNCANYEFTNSSVVLIDGLPTNDSDITYEWDFGDETIIVVTDNSPVVHNYKTAGDFIVTLTMSIAENDCRSIVTDIINIPNNCINTSVELNDELPVISIVVSDKGEIRIYTERNDLQARLFTVDGRVLSTITIKSPVHTINASLQTGLYFIDIFSQKDHLKKVIPVIVKRN